MQLSALQIVLLVLVAAEINVDRRGLSLTHARPVIVGFLCGLILGDMNSGLYIGGTFTLMSLGVAALGGSSVPDYGVATIIACAFAKTTGQGLGSWYDHRSSCWYAGRTDGRFIQDLQLLHCPEIPEICQ